MPPPDPADDWWTVPDVAAYLGVSEATVRRYRHRPRENGGLPPEDRKFGQSPAWRPATITAWNETERRGHGWRAGARRKGAL
jgi:transposase